MPQESEFNSVLCNILISDLDQEIGGMLVKCVDDTKLGGIPNTPDNRIRIQENFDYLE